MRGDLDPDTELAIPCIIATGLKYIWEARAKKKRVSVFGVRAELEALISLLRRSRYRGAGERIFEVINI